MEEIYMDFVSDFSFTEVKEMQKKYAEHYLIKFLDSEIERLEKELVEIETRFGDNFFKQPFGQGRYTAVQDQIIRLKDIKKQLE